ncbi:MAG: hypothetical protein RBR22_12275 [Desulfuromonas sp.]|nr:hypothetical protein [Desulfuromonas sp.]
MNITWQQLGSCHLKELRLLAKLAADASLPLYIVGGCLRDALLKRSSADFDLASAGDPTALAKEFSRLIGGHWFSLDAQRGYSRVVYTPDVSPANRHPLQVDFAPLRAETIEADLALRDFSINAMATALVAPMSPESQLQLIDPLAAREDLVSGCIRMCSSEVLNADPLRIIKGLRHCAQLGFSIEPSTLEAFARYAPLLQQVAGERIRNELAKLLVAHHHLSAIASFILSGVASILGFHGDVHDTLQKYATLQNQVTTIFNEPSITKYAKCDVGDDFNGLSLLRLISLLRCCNLDDGNIDIMLGRLHFNRRLQKILSFAGKTEIDQFNNFCRLSCSVRGQLLWLQQMSAPLPESLLVCALLANMPIDLSEIGQLYTHSLALLKNNKIVPLLTSKQIGQYLPDLVNKRIGTFYSDLNQQEILGHVNNQQDAIDYLLKWH